MALGGAAPASPARCQEIGASTVRDWGVSCLGELRSVADGGWRSMYGTQLVGLRLPSRSLQRPGRLAS